MLHQTPLQRPVSIPFVPLRNSVHPLVSSRPFEVVVLVLIVCSLVAFSLETLPDLPPAVQAALSAFEVAITIVFTIEYALRVIAATRKRDYVLSIYGICDLLAILPFYVAAAIGLDLRYLRAVRMLRIVTLLKLVRLNKAFSDFARTIRLAKEQLIIVSVAFAILLFISASGIYYFENEAQPQHFQSIFHSLWWAIVTLTTLGYGDVYPITAGGRIFTGFMVLIGLGIVAVPAGIFASALSQVARTRVGGNPPE